MAVERNLYRAPEAEVSHRQASEPRPFLVFLAGAATIGVGIPFGLLAALGTRNYLLGAIDGGWLYFLEHPSSLWMTPVTCLCILFSTGLFAAGWAFLKRKGRRGRRILIASAIPGLAIAWIFASVSI